MTLDARPWRHFTSWLGAAASPRPDGFAAGGTLPRAPHIAVPDQRRRLQLTIELLVLFVALPFLMRYAVFTYRVPLFYALPPVLLLIAAFLFLDPGFSLKRELKRAVPRDTLLSVFKIFAVGAGLVAAAVALILPEHLFGLVKNRTGLWAKVLMLYPFTSVLTQEFMYRAFFFHRYGPLFSNRWVLITVNAAVFAIGHVLFRNWIAVGGTFLAGLLLAWRYERTRSFWAVWIEHVLWGWLVFTIGLGVFFFTGFKNPAW